MKTHTMNMFAVTNEDLPVFSGATVAVEVAEFNPPVVEEDVKPMAMFDPITAEALAVCEACGPYGVKQIEDWIWDHNVMACYRQIVSKQRALIIYAQRWGIEVKEGDHPTTYNGWLNLSDALKEQHP